MNRRHVQKEKQRKKSHATSPTVPYNARFKVLLLGESLVGKTSILRRFISGNWTETTKATIGVDFLNKVVPIEDKRIDLQIWDTAGQEKYRTITRSYIRGASGVIVVFDITDMDSFRSLAHWFEFIEEMNLSEATTIILGNKCDAEHLRMVTQENAQQYANKNSVPYMEVSAKEGTNIEEAFFKLAMLMIEKDQPHLLNMYRRSSEKGFAFDYSIELPKPLAAQNDTTGDIRNGKSHASETGVRSHEKKRKFHLSSRKLGKKSEECCTM